MKVLMLSTDANILKEGSLAQERMIEYGPLVEELHIVIKVPSQRLVRLWRKSSQPEDRKVQNFNNVFLYPVNSGNRLLYFFRAYNAGKKILSGGGQWLITSQDPFENGLMGYWLKKKFKFPLQLQIHTDFLSPFFVRESVLNKIRVRLAKYLLPKADGVRVVSQRIWQALEVSGIKLKKSPFILSIFTDVKKIQDAPIETNLHQKYPQFDFIILTVGRFTKEKNMGLGIEAMAEMIKKYPKTGLIIVGDGPDQGKLKSKIARLPARQEKFQPEADPRLADGQASSAEKLSSNVFIEPRRNDLASYYKSADLFLLTSNYEGWGLVVAEAMAGGCPIVMTDVGCAGELVKDGENGLIVKVGDKTVIAAAVESLIENPEKLRAIKQNNLEKAKAFRTKEEYLNRYKKSWEI